MGKKLRPDKSGMPLDPTELFEEYPAPEMTSEKNTAPANSAGDEPAESLIIGDDGYEHRALERRRSELNMIREEVSRERKEWLYHHRTILIVIASVLVLVLIFLGIKIYNDANNPLSRFISASSKNLGSSFSFAVSAEKDGEAVMTFDGAMKTDTLRQRIEVEYEAEYTDYSYRNVLYTDNLETYKGNYYNGQWTFSSVTDKVSDFFDFFKDYRVGRFDGGSFLRFTELNSDYAAYELTSFVNSLKGRFATDSPAAKITYQRNGDGSTDFCYDISLIAIAEIIRDEGAPAFFRSRDYDAFVAKLDANRESIEEAECTLSYTVSSSGYLSKLEIELAGGGSSYAVRCEMGDFGKAVPDIPDEFFEQSHIEKAE